MKKRLFLLLAIVCFLSVKTTALNYYWIGGSGNWSNLSHWATTSGGTTLHVQIPTALDDVFFDINSFSSAGQVVNFDAQTTLVHSINWAGATATPQMVGSNLIKIYGSLNFIPDLDISNLTGQINFESTTPGQTITMAGQHFNGAVDFNGIGGGWTLLDKFDISQQLSLNGGALDFNNQLVNASAFYSYTSTAVRSLNMGSSVFNVSGESSNTCWIVKSAGLTLQCGTSVINFNRYDESEMQGDNTGSLVFYDVNFNAASATGMGQILGSYTFHNVNFHCQGSVWNTNTFNSLTFDKDGQLQSGNTFNNLRFTPGYTYSLWSGSTQTVNDTFNVSGSCAALITINTNNTGSPASITHPAGTVNIQYAVMRDIYTAGAANFIASNSTDLGNNTGWTFNSSGAQNLYWVGNSGNWDDGSHWSLTSGGIASGCLPTPMNNVFFDANSFSVAGATVFVNSNIAYCKNMSWEGATNSPVFSSDLYTSSTLKIYGSLVFSPNMITQIWSQINFESVIPGQTITMAGQHFNGAVDFNGIGGGWTLLDKFDISQQLSLNGGALDFNNQLVNASAFYSYTSTAVRSLNMGSSVFNVSGESSNTCWIVKSAGLTLQCGTSVINFNRYDESEMQGDNTGSLVFYDVNFNAASATGMGQILGSYTFHNVNFHCQGSVWNTNTFNSLTFDKDGQLQSGNTFNNLRFTPGYTYSLWSGSTQTVNDTFNVSGSCAALITINTNNTGSPASITHPAGTVNIQYAVMRDIYTAGAANFIASNSTDLGNNTGWTFNSSGAQNLYWVGNSGNWDDGSHWSLTSGGIASGCLPTPMNNVFFDANSFSVAGATVFVNSNIAYCKNMSWEGATNSPVFSSDLYTSSTLKIYGSLVFSPNMITQIWSQINFESVIPGQTITMAGQHFNGAVDFNGIGGGWTLLDKFDISQQLSLNGGALDFNNQLVNASAFYSYTSTAVRSLNMGSSVFNVSGESSNTCWIVKSAGLTLQCGTSVINFNRYDESEMQGDNTGSLVFYDVNFNAASATGMGQILGSYTFHNVNFHCQGSVWNTNTFNSLTFDKDGQLQSGNTFNNLSFTPGYTYLLWSGTTQTIHDRWLIQGTCTSYIVLQTNNDGSPAIISKNIGSVLGHNIHVKDIHCTGAANFMGYNSVDLGGNTGWQFSTLPALGNPGAITGSTNLCEGATATYTVSSVQGAIYYQWTTPAGSSIVSGQGDTAIVVNWGSAASGNLSVRSFNGCSYSADSSNALITLGVAVMPLVTLSVIDTSICPGATAIFTAAVLNAGTATVNYEFTVNGNSVQNSHSNTYTTTTLSDNDLIACNISLSGGSLCYASVTAASNTILMAVGQNVNLIPLIHIIGTGIGTSVDIASAITNGGSFPAYQWQDSTINHSWQDITAANNSTFTYTPQLTGDKVRCKLSGNANCGTYDTAVSNVLTFTLNSDSIIILGRLYPNPVHTALTIDHLDLAARWETVEITDQNGARKYFRNILGESKIIINVQALSNSYYYVILKSKLRSPAHFRFIKL